MSNPALLVAARRSRCEPVVVQGGAPSHRTASSSAHRRPAVRRAIKQR